MNFVDRWRVDAFLELVMTGRARALVLQCSRTGESDRDLVVKTVDVGITERSLFCEFFGNIVARAVGLHTPEPAIVHIDLDAAAFINATPAVRAVGKSVPPGVAVGCSYLRPGVLPPRTTGLSAAQIDEAALIYAYDYLVHHPDRRVDNPNLLMFKEHLIAIDFDMTFSVLWDVISGVPAWEVSKLKFPPHYFRQLLRESKFVDWQKISDTVLGYNLDDLDAFVQLLPQEWHDDGARAVEHLREVQNHAAEFRWELLRTLS